MTDQNRIDLALQCHDCDRIPKVPRAGSIESSPEGEYQIMHNGLRMLCDSHYGHYNVEVISGLRGHHEPQEESVFHEVLNHITPGSVILELGSFWAYYSLWFLNRVPDGRAVLVEPIPSALAAGQRNFSLNGAEGTFIHAAIGAESKSIAPVELWRDMIVSAPTVSVDSLMKTQDLKQLGILHADIQGHEVAMLEGASDSLRNGKIDWVILSTHGENLHQQCLRFLRRYGYHIVAEHTPAESFSVDGLIAASRTTSPKMSLSRNSSAESRLKRWKSFLRVNLLEPLRLKPQTH